MNNKMVKENDRQVERPLSDDVQDQADDNIDESDVDESGTPLKIGDGV